jgi:hypothetical protein
MAHNESWRASLVHFHAIMNQLPLWFLVLALFLPRVSLVIAYFANDLSAFNLIAWVPGMMAVIIPRGLMLILIFQDRGMSAWLLVHAIAMAVVYAGAGSGSRGS